MRRFPIPPIPLPLSLPLIVICMWGIVALSGGYPPPRALAQAPPQPSQPSQPSEPAQPSQPSQPAQPSSSTPTLATYEQWLQEALRAAQRDDLNALNAVAPNIIQTTAVSNPATGGTIAVDNQWLANELHAPTPDMAAIRTRLGAMVDALAQPAYTLPSDAQQRLDQMLSEPPFASQEGKTLLQQLIEKILDALEWLLSPLGNEDGTARSLLGMVIWVVGIILIVGILFLVARNIYRSLTAEVRLQEQQETLPRLSAKAAQQQAQSLANQGDYRTAIRYLYLSALLWLDERNLLIYDHALTNREYLAQLQDVTLRERLKPIVETFDRVWYGHAPVSADEFYRYQQHIEAVYKVRPS